MTPENGYAPSIPLINKVDKTNIKDLFMRAKAGIKTGDLQKEAHLNFYSGMLYETDKNYIEVILNLSNIRQLSFINNFLLVQ